MCVYCKPASAILDTLWQNEAFRRFFYERGYELSDLGPLTHDVFVPAYLRVKQGLAGGLLEPLEAEVMEQVLSPLVARPSFREVWESWDQPTRDAFLREQAELKLAERLLAEYAMRFEDAYRRAFLTHEDHAHP